MKRLLLLSLLWSAAALGQTQIQLLSPALSPSGTEIIPLAQQALSTQYTPNNINCTLSPNWCGAGISLTALKAWIGSGPGGGLTSIGINSGGILSFAGSPLTSNGNMSVVWTGNSGGIPCFNGTTSLASSAAITSGALVVGGGAGGCVGAVASLGTTTTVYHGNASGPGTFSQVNLTTDVVAILPGTNGGTGANNGSITETYGGNFSTNQAITINSTGASTVSVPPGTVSLGYLGFPLTGGASKTSNYTFVAADASTRLQDNCGSTCANTIPANASVPFPVGTQLGFHVLCSASAGMTIAITSDTLYWSPSATTGTRTLPICGDAVATKETTTTWEFTCNGCT
jgi:hypothetical protein